MRSRLKMLARYMVMVASAQLQRWQDFGSLRSGFRLPCGMVWWLVLLGWTACTPGSLPPALSDLPPQLGNPLSTLQFDGLSVRDTLLEGDEGIAWPGRVFSQDGRRVLLAEANWEQRDRVQRIVVLDPAILAGKVGRRPEYAEGIGQRLGEVRAEVADEIPSGPDGYLFLTWRADPRVHLELDISGYPFDHPVYLGQAALSELPDSLLVTGIVIQ